MPGSGFGTWVESRGRELRQKGAVRRFACLDPLLVAAQMKVTVVVPQQIAGLSSSCLSQLLVEDCASWSAGTLILPNGICVVVVNPKHSKTRQRVSLLEELSHIHLAHKPTKLVTSDDVAFRTWSGSGEKEAYAVAAAALLPQWIMKGARTLGHSADQVARSHCVSIALVRYRANVLRIHLRRLKRHPNLTPRSNSPPRVRFH